LKTHTQIEQECKNLSRFLKIFYIALRVPSIGHSQLESQRQREVVFKLQFETYWLERLESYCLARQDGTFLFLMVQFLLKNPNLEPEIKGFEEPKSSNPSRFSKKMKDLFKNFKKTNYLKEITNSLISLYSSYPYKYIFLIFLALLTFLSISQFVKFLQFLEISRLGYISHYLMELNSRLRLIELLERYKEAKFLKSRSFENLPFQNIPINHSLKSLTNLEIEEYKSLEQAVRDNTLKSRLLVYQITKLAEELNLNPKSTLSLIILSLLVLRFRNDPSNTASFILLVKFLLKMFGSTDSSSWPDPNE
jgi:hypothetical protein